MKHFILEKARPHKYLKRLGFPGHWRYFYNEKEFKEKQYQIAQKWVLKRMDDLLDVQAPKIKFYTHRTVPKAIQEAAIHTYGIHPPAYVDPKTMSVVVDLDFSGYQTATDMVKIIGHELGHLLVWHFQDKKVLSKDPLSYTYKVRSKFTGAPLIIYDPGGGTEENLANMFSNYLSGAPLHPKELKKLKEIVQFTGKPFRKAKSENVKRWFVVLENES